MRAKTGRQVIFPFDLLFDCHYYLSSLIEQGIYWFSLFSEAKSTQPTDRNVRFNCEYAVEEMQETKCRHKMWLAPTPCFLSSNGAYLHDSVGLVVNKEKGSVKSYIVNLNLAHN